MTPLTEDERQFVVAHHRLAAALAQRASEYYVADFDALLSEANFALMRASKLYDPAKGCKPTTYLTYYIRRVLHKLAVRERRRGLTDMSRYARPTYERAFPEDLCHQTLPIGWELESEDECRYLAREFPPETARTLLRCFLDAGDQYQAIDRCGFRVCVECGRYFNKSNGAPVCCSPECRAVRDRAQKAAANLTPAAIANRRAKSRAACARYRATENGKAVRERCAHKSADGVLS